MTGTKFAKSIKDGVKDANNLKMPEERLGCLRTLQFSCIGLGCNDLSKFMQKLLRL